ncbi:MAG: MlaD family protein [candidate division Zixibacteria bacterium]|nr:MlaD family protein [candidate division Zixibacteria bacterium]
MSTRKHIEFRVGVVMLVALVVLGGSLYWLQGYRLERNAEPITVVYDDVGSLAIGDNVTVSGVRRGNVTNLTLTDHGVEVELMIFKDVVLRKDATFTIKSLGVMGERFIAIYPGKETDLLDRTQSVQGEYESGLPELMGLMGDMIVEVRQIVFTLKRTLVSDSSLEKFNNTVNNFERLSGSLADFMENNDAKFDQTVQGFYDASRNINTLLKKGALMIDSSSIRMDRIGIQMERFVSQLDTLSVSARKFADALDNGEGTAHLLLHDRRLYDDLRGVTSSVDDLIADIKANPRKYINLKVEIF